jgi:hypothetical protein
MRLSCDPGAIDLCLDLTDLRGAIEWRWRVQLSCDLQVRDAIARQWRLQVVFFYLSKGDGGFLSVEQFPLYRAEAESEKRRENGSDSGLIEYKIIKIISFPSSCLAAASNIAFRLIEFFFSQLVVFFLLFGSWKVLRHWISFMLRELTAASEFTNAPMAAFQLFSVFKMENHASRPSSLQYNKQGGA